MTSRSERARNTRSSEAKSGSRSRRKARTTGCGSGIFGARSSTSRADGGRCSACPRPPASVRPEEWIDRVHADDIAALKEALEAHLSGKTEHFQHEHRIRHEDGTYRRFLCRGVAVRGAGRRSARIAGSLTDTTERAIAQEQLAQRRLPRSADRALQPRGLRGGARAPARRVQGNGAPAADSRRSISTSTASRSSTTASATWWATSCSPRCRAASSRACGRETRSPGWAETSSRFS